MKTFRFNCTDCPVLETNDKKNVNLPSSTGVPPGAEAGATTPREFQVPPQTPNTVFQTLQKPNNASHHADPEGRRLHDM